MNPSQKNALQLINYTVTNVLLSTTYNKKYMQAIIDNDLDLASKIINFVAHNLGYMGPYFHGTKNDGYVLKFKLGNPTHNNYGLLGDLETKRHAIFFSKSQKFAKEYGSVNKYYIKVDKIHELEPLYHEYLDKLNAFEQRDLYLDIKYLQDLWMLFDDVVGVSFREFLLQKNILAVKFKEKNQEDNIYETVAVVDPNIIIPGDTIIKNEFGNLITLDDRFYHMQLELFN